MRRLVIQGDIIFVSRLQAATINRLRHEYHVQDVILMQNSLKENTEANQMVSLALQAYRHVFLMNDYEIQPQDIVISRQGCISWSEVSITDMSKEVLRYAYDHEFMIEDLAQLFVNEKRWNHVKSMTELTVDLAKAHHLDLHQAKIAGLFHDCTKRWRMEADYWMRFVAPEHMDEAKAVYHQYTGAAYMRRYLHMMDDKAIYAVLHHVHGDGKTPLAMCLYIADKLDPSRGYDSSQEIALCKKDLKKGCAVVKEQQDAYLRKTGVIA